MLGQPHRHFDIVASSNEVARVWAQDGAPHGAVVTAGAQTVGRGRRGRSWSSPPGKGLYLSLILRPAPPTQTSHFTILAALATARAVEQQTGLKTHTKWPNDILLHNRKIGGILSEAHLEQGQLDFLVIGVGLNVNLENAELPPRPLFPASSLLLETNREWPIETLRQVWLSEMDELWRAYGAGAWGAARAEFERRCVGLGQSVRVVMENETYQGVATGLDDDGILLVQTESAMLRVVAGDVIFNDG